MTKKISVNLYNQCYQCANCYLRKKNKAKWKHINLQQLFWKMGF